MVDEKTTLEGLKLILCESCGKARCVSKEVGVGEKADTKLSM